MFSRSLLCLTLLLFSFFARAEDTSADWKKFSLLMKERTQEQEYEGIAYIVSGSLVLIGSGVGLHNSDDLFAKTVYNISQSLGIAAIGYGGYLYSIGDEDKRFFNIIENTASLSLEQKSAILKNYNADKDEVKRKTRLIRVVTHSLIAAVNVFNATKEEDTGLRSGLYFVGGVNALAAISIAF